MKIQAKAGRDDIATVYIAETEEGKQIEFVESVQPPLTREEKWVLIVSSLFGCPVKCRFCDAGGSYQGILSKEQIFSQIDYMVKKHYPDRKIPCEKFKIQFARMGEPLLNPNIPNVLEELPKVYDAPGLLPSLSTVAPMGCDKAFQQILEIKKKLYNNSFQMQFSIHTTDLEKRNWLIPIKKWSFEQISEYGEVFYAKGDKKISLNFALAENMPVDPKVLMRYFSPDKYIIKITPVNPTFNAINNKITSLIVPDRLKYEVIDNLAGSGYEVILSIGELEENLIGSNCGQYLTKYNEVSNNIENSYTYELEKV
jgi:23S rRNA (adenine2503-C2)-methyltransferase